MRIRNSGQGGGGFGGWGSRSDSFRKRHHVGQKVRGMVLKNMPDNMAWVEINGDRLLAQLEVIHPEGSRLTFIIKQLTPHIILKELALRQSVGQSALGIASSFDTARTLFENKLRSELKRRGTAITALSLPDFMELLAHSPELHACYLDASNCVNVISAGLEKNGSRLFYQPWLYPDTRRQVTCIRQQKESDFTEIIIEFDHSVLGLARVEFLHKKATTAFKLKVQRAERSTELLNYLKSRTHPELKVEAKLLGISKLPRQNHGGLITEILFKG